MSRYNKTPIRKIAEVLDRASEGGSFTRIGKSVGVDKSTVFKILEDFPLWGFFRTKDQPSSKGGRPRGS